MILCPCCAFPLRAVSAAAVVKVNGDWVTFPVCHRCNTAVNKRPMSAYARLIVARAKRHLAEDCDRFGGINFGPDGEFEAVAVAALACDPDTALDTIIGFWGEDVVT